MKKNLLLLVLFLLLSACHQPGKLPELLSPVPSQAPKSKDKIRQTWHSQVTSVSDGDTLRVKNPDGGKNIAIRLYGIDTPEKRGRSWEEQPHSQESTKAARALMPNGSTVGITPYYKDRYRRTVAVITLPNGKVLQEELLKQGLAWVYPQYCKQCDAWKNLEKEARRKKIGIWSSPSPTPPWEWRKNGRDSAKKNAASKQ